MAARYRKSNFPAPQTLPRAVTDLQAEKLRRLYFLCRATGLSRSRASPLRDVRDEPACKTAGDRPHSSKDYTLALIRVVSRRLKHIDEEVVSIGVALSNGLVSAAKARELVDDIAPGCIDAVALSILEGSGNERLENPTIRHQHGLAPPLLANAITAFREAPAWFGVLAYDEFSRETVIRSSPPWDVKVAPMV